MKAMAAFFFKSRQFFVLQAAIVFGCMSAISLAAQQKTITLLYTNDFHSAVEPITATWLVDHPKIGGIRNLAAWVAMMRRSYPDAFLFDSGDVFEGPAISTLTRGQALIEMFNTVGFDAACLGNHEFDYGIEPAASYVREEHFPVLAANLFYKDSGKPFAKPYAIVERNGIKIAVIGVFGPTSVSATLVSTWNTLELRDPKPILAELIPRLRKEADLVVVLTHEGLPGPMQTDAEAHPEVQRPFDTDKDLVNTVPGIDVLIGGHPHRGIEVPWVSPQTGSIVVQTYGHGTTLGYLQLTVDTSAHKIASEHGSLLRVAPDVFPVPPQVDATVTKWEKKADELGGMQVAVSPAPLTRNYNGESALGDLVTDSLRWKSGAQIAFENAGGIRDDLPAGNVTRAGILSVVPFFNTMVTGDLTGTQIRSLLEQGLTLQAGLIQVSGLVMTADMNQPEYHRLVSVTVNGQPLEDEKKYTVAATSFMATGGDNYQEYISHAGSRDTGLLLSDVLEQYAREQGTLVAPAANRIIQLSGALK
jgi:2',3'-cyclic-nucleotide 2'-phosphodiesterase (5'-nucleotidase family)